MSDRLATIYPVRITDLFAITRLTFANMTGVDPYITRLASHTVGRLTGYLTLPLYMVLAGQGYKVVRQGQIVGCAFLELRRCSGYVFNVNVAQPFRRQGIASSMMNHLETVTRTSGRSWMALQVDVANLPATKAYARLGYHTYHPHYLHRAGASTFPSEITRGLSVERVGRFEGYQQYRLYLEREQHLGDRWAANVARDYAANRTLGGSYWRCVSGSVMVGCVWKTGPDYQPVFRVVLDSDYWGRVAIIDILTQLVNRLKKQPRHIDLYFGSSAHHEASAPLLEKLGFRTQSRERLLMFKRLTPS